MRGPLVLCVEGVDLAGGTVSDLVLPDDAPLATEFRADLLGGVQVISWSEAETTSHESKTKRFPSGDENTVEQSTIKVRQITAIPYFAWANRDQGEMAVWLARTPEAAGDEP
jgi:hypothetical protein